jgi:WD40 repeat protein
MQTKRMQLRRRLLPLLALVAGYASRAMAQSPGTFTSTGKMTTERMYHTATLLTNGKVLIAGGWAIATNMPVCASAELYDPSTGSFTATGDMTTSRFNHTATLLPDGKVLIAGGDLNIIPGYPTSILASAELYDPSTGTFSATGDMTTARAAHSATLLDNGKVLIASGSPLTRAELYDPSTGAFTATGEMSTSQISAKATLLSNGKVLIEGGYSSENPGAELYDPATGTFSRTGGPANPNLFASSASLLTNGKVLATLEYSCDPDDQAEMYDPSTASFAATANMTASRGYSTATLLPDGKVLIAGEDFPGLFNGGSAELYDPATGIFNTDGNMLTYSREGHTATLLPDGTVLFAGGWDCCGYSIATAEIYHPAVLKPSPVLLSVSSDRQGAILHASTQQIVSPGNPAVSGEALEIFLTGLVDGSVIPPQVAIGGRSAEVLWFGAAPGYVGLNQINVLMPSGVASGSAAPVRLRYLDRPSNEVTIPVQ